MTTPVSEQLAAEAAALDLGDPLGEWRDQFVTPEPDLAYLDGNSLGMTPKRTLTAVAAVIERDWAQGLIRSWDQWIHLPQQVGDALAPLIGAAPGEVAVHDSVSVNLYQLIHAALRLRPDRTVIAVDRCEFPTDRYIAAGIAQATGHQIHHHVDDDLPWDQVAVVVRSLVDYRTAEVADLDAETARAAAAGALIIWDLSHAVGVLPVDLHGAGAHMAVGCTYKFLNGGPGAPGFSFVAADLIGSLDQPIRGWFGHRSMFEMSDAYEPQADIGRTLIGTPGIIGLTAAQVGIEITAAAGIGAIATKAQALTEFALRCCDHLNLHSPSPRDPRRRGGHISVQHPDAAAIVRALAEHDSVIADFREPDLIRLGCSPLTTRFADVLAGTTAIARHL